jgi:hypothetical protein
MERNRKNANTEKLPTPKIESSFFAKALNGRSSDTRK